MYFRQFFDPTRAAMSYLLADSASGAAVIVDPVVDPCQALIFNALLAERRLDLRLVLLTHLHHGLHDGVEALYPGAGIVAGMAPGARPGWRAAADLDVLPFGEEGLRVIATPGHTPHSVSYLWRDRLFCGDALELGGCAVSQDNEAEPGRIYDSVTRRLFTLSDEVLVFPGHDFHGRTVSTIGEERRHNPFFQSLGRDAFLTAFHARQQGRTPVWPALST